MKYLVRLKIYRVPKDLRDEISSLIRGIGPIEKDDSYGGEDWTDYVVNLIYEHTTRRAPHSLYAKLNKALSQQNLRFDFAAKVYPETVFSTMPKNNSF